MERVKVQKFLAGMTEFYRRTPAAAVPARSPLVRSITSELTGTEVTVEEDQVPMAYEDDLQLKRVSPPARALVELALVLFNLNEFVYVY